MKEISILDESQLLNRRSFTKVSAVAALSPILLIHGNTYAANPWFLLLMEIFTDLANFIGGSITPDPPPENSIFIHIEGGNTGDITINIDSCVACGACRNSNDPIGNCPAAAITKK